jgi:XapX domain-containing protein
MKLLIGIALALSIGALCRLTGLPLPAPQALIGALLVLAMSTGVVVGEHIFSRQQSPHG